MIRIAAAAALIVLPVCAFTSLMNAWYVAFERSRFAAVQPPIARKAAAALNLWSSRNPSLG